MNGADFKPCAQSITMQGAAVLAALRTGPKTTTELRLLCGVMSPASRVLDLRKAGYDIVTLRRARQAFYDLREGGA